MRTSGADYAKDWYVRSMYKKTALQWWGAVRFGMVLGLLHKHFDAVPAAVEGVGDTVNAFGLLHVAEL